MSITIEVSVGELLDKLAILEIKFERLTDHGQRANVERELDKMRGVWRACEYSKLTLDADRAALKAINEHLWEIEDRIRGEGKYQSFRRGFYRTGPRGVFLQRRARCDQAPAQRRKRLGVDGRKILQHIRRYAVTRDASPTGIRHRGSDR